MEEAGRGGVEEYTYTYTSLREILTDICFGLSLQLHTGIYPGFGLNFLSHSSWFTTIITPSKVALGVSTTTSMLDTYLQQPGILLLSSGGGREGSGTGVKLSVLNKIQ